jgi:large subunit ribosomal protein L17
MRHRHGGWKLNRNSTHRIAMFRNMTMALIRHERIITTVAKAKALRPFVEKLITLAREGSLHSRRQVISKLGPTADAEVNPEGDDAADRRTIVQKLFSDLGPRFKDRPGGYTRIVKRLERRLGDAGETAYIMLLGEGETKTKVRQTPPSPAPAPAPAPEAKTEEAPKPEDAPKPEGEQPAQS